MGYLNAYSSHHERGEKAEGHLCHQDPGSDRRQRARFQSILRVGKLRLHSQEQFCLVRNISMDGLMLELYSPCAVGDTVRVDLMADRTVSGKVIWVKDSIAGVQFDKSIDVHGVLSRDFDGIKGWVPRSPRLNIEFFARLRCGALCHKVEICDVSQGGVRFKVDTELQINEQIVLLISDLGTLAGIVRWQKNKCVGMAFNQPIPFASLAHWVSDRQMSKRSVNG